MPDKNVQRRIDLVLSIMYDLKDIYSSIKVTAGDIEEISEEFYREIIGKYGCDVQNDTCRFNSNIEKIKNLNQEMVIHMNTWYEFVKNPNEVCKLTFPLKYYFRKRKITERVKKINLEISETMIENRFIKEHLINREHELEIKAVAQINQGEKYQNYEKLIEKKNVLISELKYLVPSIPDLCPFELDPEQIDSLIERLSKIAAA